MTRPKKITKTLRLSEESLRILRRVAKEENRTINNALETILMRKLGMIK